MNIKIQSIHFDADKKLIAFVEEKVSKLKHFWDHIEDVDVFLRLEKAEDHNNKVAEIKTHFSGKLLFSKEHHSTFEGAVDAAYMALSRQVKREKEKHQGL